MKPIFKICMAISGVLFVLGIVCIGIGALLGVTPANLVYAGNYPGSSLLHIGRRLEVAEEKPEEALPETGELEELPEQELPAPGGTNRSGAEEYYEFHDIRNLDFDLSLCELQIYPHEGDYLSLEADNVQNDFRCRQDGDTLVLEDDRPSSLKQNSMDNALRLALYLPDQALREVSIEAGAGNITLSRLTADEIDIETGVGNLTVGTLKSGEISLQTGVGECIADLIQADGKAEIEVGTGNLTLTQFDGRSLQAECGAGNVIVTAAGRETDYNYTLDAGLGNISLGHHADDGEHHHGSSGSQDHHLDIHHDADRQISINCGLGNATLNFMEE